VFAIYNVAVWIATLLLGPIALLSRKIRLFVAGRKQVFGLLKGHIRDGEPIIWIHTASLGEFEQGLPIMEMLRVQHPSHKILVTFFSPSGYEIKKNTAAADLVTYLPMDTQRNAKDFLHIVRPVLAIFVKYEIWPNYLRELQRVEIPTLLISSIFNKRQSFFKWYGGFMRKSLFTFTHIFVQDQQSADLLRGIGYSDVSIAGDTRLDRVSKIREQDNHLPFMEGFKKGRPCLVAGSTWPPDETILVEYINNSRGNTVYAIAPHNIKEDHIKALKASLTKRTVLYSEMGEQDLGHFDVLIVDTIGLLTKIYSYADIAYVGGGFLTGLHNTLEPAVFGIPVIIGPRYTGFKEAEDLVSRKGVISITDGKSFQMVMERLLSDASLRADTGGQNSHYILNNKGASAKIMAAIDPYLRH
tara:strand:- start:35572 stop:36813 length:1242 start_codon:yes stop_codon:yes gene_type:complete